MEEQRTHVYKKYYCDVCGEYIGRDDCEFDRTYRIDKTVFRIKELNLKLECDCCCGDCEEKAKGDLVSKLKSIGFSNDV